MKINELTLGRKFNLGNYESLELRVSVSPEPEDIGKQWKEATQEIIEKLNLEINKAAKEIKGSE